MARAKRDEGRATVSLCIIARNDPRIRWQHRVHEVILPALYRLSTTIHRTDVVVYHAGYDDPFVVRRKIERNLDLLKRAHSERPDDPYILLYLGWTYQGLGQM